MRRLPRINSALTIGVHVGAALRGPEETPIRENALRMYTQGSA